MWFFFLSVECRKVLSYWLNRSLGFISISLFWIQQPHEATLNNHISEPSNRYIISLVLVNSTETLCNQNLPSTDCALLLSSCQKAWGCLWQEAVACVIKTFISNKIAGNGTILCFNELGTTVLITLAFIYKLVSCVQDGCCSSRHHTLRLLS